MRFNTFVLTVLRGCLNIYIGKPARVPELARFPELISFHPSCDFSGLPKQTTGLTVINSIIINIFSHEPEIRTFASNFHGYNPQNRSQRPSKIEEENLIYNKVFVST